MVLTLPLDFRVARSTEGASIISGLILGILAGLLSLAVTLAFGEGRLIRMTRCSL